MTFAVPNYVLGRETEGWEFVAPVDVKENGQVDNYNFSEQQMQNTPEAESILEDNFTRSNGLLQNSMNPVLDHMSVPIEETVGEPQKHTYASIVAKGQSATSHPRSSFYKSTPPAFEWNRVRAPPTQLSVASSTAVERLGTEAAEEEGLHFLHLLPKEQFKKFGRLKPDGVVIRNRQECYAFVEYEDVTGAENAIQAATVQIAGQHVFIQRKRANRINAYRGGIVVCNPSSRASRSRPRSPWFGLRRRSGIRRLQAEDIGGSRCAVGRGAVPVNDSGVGEMLLPFQGLFGDDVNNDSGRKI
ncbi:hypothetical protein U1Q18_030314 [Sarracenia purpurea var. burkii]